jgi:prefoldin subunit 5
LGLAAPAFIAPALFTWATDIGVGAVGGWLAGFATQAARGENQRPSPESEELLLVETKRLINKIDNGDIELAIGICKVIEKNGSLRVFEEEYRRLVRHGNSFSDGDDVESAIHDAHNFIKALSQSLEEREREIRSLEDRISSLEITIVATQLANSRHPQNTLGDYSQLNQSYEQLNQSLSNKIQALEAQIQRLGKNLATLENFPPDPLHYDCDIDLHCIDLSNLVGGAVPLKRSPSTDIQYPPYLEGDPLTDPHLKGDPLTDPPLTDPPLNQISQ